MADVAYVVDAIEIFLPFHIIEVGALAGGKLDRPGRRAIIVRLEGRRQVPLAQLAVLLKRERSELRDNRNGQHIRILRGQRRMEIT